MLSYPDWQQLPVSAIANFKPITLATLDPQSLREALDRYSYNRFPVMENGQLRGILSRSEAVVALRENRLPQLHPAQIVPPRKVIREAQMLLLQSEDSILLVRDETSGQIIALLTLHDLLRAQEGFVAKKG